MYQSTHTGAQVDEAVDKALNPDAVPTQDSTNLVTSGGVASAIKDLGKSEDIISQLTWDTDTTFVRKRAIKYGNWVNIFVIVSPAGFGSTEYTRNIVSFPSSIKPAMEIQSACLTEPGNGVPDADNPSFLYVNVDSGAVQLRKKVPNTGFVWGSIVFPIKI